MGPISQHDDFLVIDRFDVRDSIATLKPPLLLIRGADDPASPPEYEMEIHRTVPGSQYVKLSGAGHFPMAEKPEEFNRAIDEFLASRAFQRFKSFQSFQSIDRLKSLNPQSAHDLNDFDDRTIDCVLAFLSIKPSGSRR